MLVLSRNEETAINIGSDIHVKVLSINRKSVRLGVEAPPSVRIWRDELPPAIDQQPQTPAANQVARAVRIVLVIEDDPGHAKLIRKALCEHQGTMVSVAATARGALDALGARVSSPDEIIPPDLILLDLSLPDGSGLDLLRLIRSVPELRSTPVVVLTSSEDETVANQCLESGANAFVPKSGDYDDFRSQVSRIGQFWAGDCFARRCLRQHSVDISTATADDPDGISSGIEELEDHVASGTPAKRILLADDDTGHIADYLEGKAERFKRHAAKTGNSDLRSHATALVVAASDIRARLYED